MPYIHPSSLTPFPAADIDPGLREAGLELYEEAARELASRYPRAWPEFTYERFAWAAGMVQSRTFHLQATNWVTGGTSDGRLERGRKGAGRCKGLALSLSARSPRACSLFEPSQHRVDSLGMRWSTKARSRGLHSTPPQHPRHLFHTGCELYLLPGIDMVNHSSQAEQRSTELRFTPDRTAGGERIPGEFTMLACEW